MRSQAGASRERGPHSEEAVRFRSSFDLSFAPSDIRALTEPRGDARPEMTVAFFGSGGSHGPLPTSFTEQVLERLSRQDTGAAAFLDIFHHRLVSLFYRIRKAHRLALSTIRPEKTAAARYLFSLIGVGTPSLANQLSAPNVLLRYAGLLATRPRSAVGLGTMLSDAFGIAVEVDQFVGEWCDVDPAHVTHLATRDRNNVLGKSAMIGTRVWLQDAGIRLRVGPLDAAQFAAFLPGGRAHARLTELTSFYAGRDLQVALQLLLRPQDVTQARLGAARVAWAGWLRASPPASPDRQVQVRLGAGPGSPVLSGLPARAAGSGV
jgi:type VI secretion system protein ImpH